MKKRIKYEDIDLGYLEQVEDFLPKPKDLVLKQRKVKVTMELSGSSVDFFKREAKRNGVPYQLMIRNLVDRYASRFA